VKSAFLMPEWFAFRQIDGMRRIQFHERTRATDLRVNRAALMSSLPVTRPLQRLRPWNPWTDEFDF